MHKPDFRVLEQTPEPVTAAWRTAVAKSVQLARPVGASAYPS